MTMLNELRKYSSLGTIGYYWDILGLLTKQSNIDWNEKSIDAYFKGKIIDGKDIFDGGLFLLVSSGVLEIDITGTYHTTYGFSQHLSNINSYREKILENLLEALKYDQDTYIIFSSEFCTYDFINKLIQIDISAFGLKYANLRDVLISLDFLRSHPNYPKQSFVVNRAYKSLFDKYFTEGIRKRQISPEELKNIQERQQENGLKGEKFVYDFEIQRTGREKDIEWIANYDVGAGFDIMSFQDEESTKHDRFIEVKTYSGNQPPYFYWSRNEMEVAHREGTNYYLYLVNIEKINEPTYSPIIISDPYEGVLKNDEWKKIVDKFFITYQKKT